MNKDTALILGMIVLIITLVILGPLATIFAVNTLFAAGWAYSFTNWFSVIWLQAVVYGIGRAAKK